MSSVRNSDPAEDTMGGMFPIRRVLPSDAGLLTQIALSAKRHWGYPEHWIELWRPQLTFDAQYFEGNESWAAIVAGQPVAFYTLLDQEGVAWLENLWVAPEYMGLGAGRALFHHALRLSRLRGFNLFQLEADPNAVGFYEKMGMHKIAERKYELDGRPRILPIMEMKI
jgi:ribosomal protein S18 acetylase RimI-like enzyme